MRNFILSISFICFTSLLPAATNPAVAWSSGVMRINGADHSGSANLQVGSKLETLKSAGHLYLPGGASLRLAASTQVSVQPSSIQIEGGAARIDAIPASRPQVSLQAGELNITTRGATIQRPQPSRIIVSSATETTEVRNTAGTLLALVRPGQTLAFAVANSQTSSPESKLTGCVSVENGHYFITDEVTNVKTEIEGGQPSRYKGKRVSATGKLAASHPGETPKLTVNEYSELDSSCSIAPAAIPGRGSASGSTPAAGTGSTGSAGAATGTTVATATGISKATIVMITVASMAAAGASLGIVAANNDNISQ